MSTFDEVYGQLLVLLEQRADPILSSDHPDFLATLRRFIIEDETMPFFWTTEADLESLVEVLVRVERRAGFKEAIKISTMVRYGTRYPKKFDPNGSGYVFRR